MAAVDAYRKAFAMFDKNNDGHITSAELAEVLTSLGGKAPTSAELQQMIAEVDTDNSGTVEFNEFIEMMNKRQTAKTDLTAAFKMFDINGDGLISPQEMQQVMAKLGENLSDEDISAMVKEADLDGDGLINFYEFERTNAPL
eukprot:TRINITY_DN5513_c0_g1_i2.p2 TRINITY_DN5513_c0_g1~~TRINITY_DN5513_c0_g1_i2.p2  ORF type:complete len:142 (-),score=47.06 TRINITY_DN5513_c0_g1_i2:113-538(-)